MAMNYMMTMMLQLTMTTVVVVVVVVVVMMVVVVVVIMMMMTQLKTTDPMQVKTVMAMNCVMRVMLQPM